MRRIVLDTNVLVSALWTPTGKSAKIIALMPTGEVVPCYNAAIMSEYRIVLNRPKLRFSESQTDKILDEIAKIGFSVVAKISKFPMPDESDRKFHDVAMSCGAFLITGNTKHYPQKQNIMTPSEFLESF
jgi:putative PIN family toxin of toxin-antitoxin system